MYVFQYVRPPDTKKINENWLNFSKPDKFANEEIFQPTKELSAYFHRWEKRPLLLVVGPAELVKESAEHADRPPPVRREIEKLIRTTDNARQATLLWLPDNALVVSPPNANTAWAKLIAGARSFFGDDCRGAVFSFQLTPSNLFIELRIAGPLDTPPQAEAKQIRQQIVQLPTMIEDFLATLDLDSYGRRILLRFPQMLRVTDEFTRSGVDANQAVLRCYLPVEAAHNLLMGAELALAESASPSPSPKGSAVNVAPRAGQNGNLGTGDSVAQKLKRLTTLSFPNENLEKALNLLADDIQVKVEILGGDLQLDGITKNQPIRDLDEKNKPAEEILRTIMRKANPDGKLVYVIKTPPSGGDEELLITTRAAVVKHGDKLPPELVAAPKAGK